MDGTSLLIVICIIVAVIWATNGAQRNAAYREAARRDPLMAALVRQTRRNNLGGIILRGIGGIILLMVILFIISIMGFISIFGGH